MIAQNVAAIVADHVRLTVEAIDRMYLNVYVPRLHCAFGAVNFPPRTPRTAARVPGADGSDEPRVPKKGAIAEDFVCVIRSSDHTRQGSHSYGMRLAPSMRPAPTRRSQ